jgi:hypothetical protein
MDFGGKTVAIDFDGVLHSYDSGWVGRIPTDPPIEGAQEFICLLIERNAKPVIHSTRAAESAGYAGILSWLRKHNFPPVEVTAQKPVAVAYIDDRAVTFRRTASGRGNWAACLEQVEELAEARPHGAGASR